MNACIRMSYESIILDLLSRWEAAWVKGEPVSIKELCAEHPALIDQLRNKAEKWKSINGLLEAKTLLPLPGNPVLPHEDLVAINSVFCGLEYLAEGGLGVA